MASLSHVIEDADWDLRALENFSEGYPQSLPDFGGSAERAIP
jgi:hypothetical protein